MTEKHTWPQVVFRTLGEFEVIVDGKAVDWDGAVAGRRQIERALVLLVSSRERPIRRDIVEEVAGGHEDSQRRHVIGGLRRLFRRWGIPSALLVRQAQVMLRRHEHWCTDTDVLERLLSTAQHVAAAGDVLGAIRMLECASDLCNGEYLPLLAKVAPQHHRYADAIRWQNQQKLLLQTLARWCLDLKDESHTDLALQSAGRAISFDRFDPHSYRLIAQAVRRSGNEELARRFEEQARALDQNRPD